MTAIATVARIRRAVLRSWTRFVTVMLRINVWFAPLRRLHSHGLARMTNKTTGPDPFAFLPDGSELAGLIRAFDWRNTALGELQQWPVYLRTAVGIMLRSAVPMTLQWGREGWMIYNDAYRDIAATRHPDLLGKTIDNTWAEAAQFRQRVVLDVLAGTDAQLSRPAFFAAAPWPARKTSGSTSTTARWSMTPACPSACWRSSGKRPTASAPRNG